MATDAGHQHVRRLGELRADLQAQAGQRDHAPLAAAISQVAQVLPKLDFGLLQQKGGFLARLSGKNKSAIAEFASQYDEIETAAKALAELAKGLQVHQGDQARIDLALLEFEVEFRAIDKIIDQGARWLQDMRSQLKTREAEGGDEPAQRQIREDAQRCELLVARLKMLRALSSAAQQSHQQVQAAAARRAAIVKSLQTSVASHVKEWRSRIAPLANAAREGESPALSLEGPMDCHRDLQLCIKQAGADCGQLQAQEKALAESLDALGGQLQAAAA
jgi:uncharacterized protein YaaN involved in tellurite resistance